MLRRSPQIKLMADVTSKTMRIRNTGTVLESTTKKKRGGGRRRKWRRRRRRRRKKKKEEKDL